MQRTPVQLYNLPDLTLAPRLLLIKADCNAPTLHRCPASQKLLVELAARCVTGDQYEPQQLEPIIRGFVANKH